MSVMHHRPSFTKTFEEQKKRLPTPSHRHAAPSAPWPWVDISDSQILSLPFNLNTDLSRFITFLDTDPEQLKSELPPVPPLCDHKTCGGCWVGYPQSRFPNWTKEQVERSKISDVIVTYDRSQPCVIYHVDVNTEGLFTDAGVLEAHDSDREATWKAIIRSERPRDNRVRALFMENLSGPVLQMLGVKYNIEPFFFSSCLNWIPSWYQENPVPQKGDHITITLTFLKSTDRHLTKKPSAQSTSSMATIQDRATSIEEVIDTQSPLKLRSSRRSLVPDLLAVHLIRNVDGSTIISYHPTMDHPTTNARYLHDRIRFAGQSVYWQSIFQNSSDPTFVLLTFFWHALYAWDEALEHLYDHICWLESKVLDTSDMNIAQELHIIRAHHLHYSFLLEDFQKAVTFIQNTPNPAMESLSERDRDYSAQMMQRECATLLSEINRLEMSRRMQNKRLKNVMNLVFGSVNIEDNKRMQRMTEAAVNDSAAMKARNTENLQNMTIVATFLSGVTAGALQVSFSFKEELLLNFVVNALWFCSLVLSLGVAIYGFLALTWKKTTRGTRDQRLTRWINFSRVHFSTRAVLTVSIISFVTGLVFLPFPDNQSIHTRLVTLAVTLFVLFAMSSWIGYESWLRQLLTRMKHRPWEGQSPVKFTVLGHPRSSSSSLSTRPEFEFDPFENHSTYTPVHLDTAIPMNHSATLDSLPVSYPSSHQPFPEKLSFTIQPPPGGAATDVPVLSPITSSKNYNSNLVLNETIQTAKHALLHAQNKESDILLTLEQLQWEGVYLIQAGYNEDMMDEGYLVEEIHMHLDSELPISEPQIKSQFSPTFSPFLSFIHTPSNTYILLSELPEIQALNDSGSWNALPDGHTQASGSTEHDSERIDGGNNNPPGGRGGGSDRASGDEPGSGGNKDEGRNNDDEGNAGSGGSGGQGGDGNNGGGGGGGDQGPDSEEGCEGDGSCFISIPFSSILFDKDQTGNQRDAFAISSTFNIRVEENRKQNKPAPKSGWPGPWVSIDMAALEGGAFGTYLAGSKYLLGRSSTQLIGISDQDISAPYHSPQNTPYTEDTTKRREDKIRTQGVQLTTNPSLGATMTAGHLSSAENVHNRWGIRTRPIDSENRAGKKVVGRAWKYMHNDSSLPPVSEHTFSNSASPSIELGVGIAADAHPKLNLEVGMHWSLSSMRKTLFEHLVSLFRSTEDRQLMPVPAFVNFLHKASITIDLQQFGQKEGWATRAKARDLMPIGQPSADPPQKIMKVLTKDGESQCEVKLGRAIYGEVFATREKVRSGLRPMSPATMSGGAGPITTPSNSHN